MGLRLATQVNQVHNAKSRLRRKRYMKASPTAAITYIVPGEVIATKGEGSRRRHTYIRGVLSSVSDFIAVIVLFDGLCLTVDDEAKIKRIRP